MIQSKVTVFNVDNVYVNVYCDDGIAYELNTHFEFKVPGAEFTPKYRARVWNGKIYLFNLKTRNIYRGLVPYIEKFCKDRGYSYEYKGVDENDLSDEDADKFIKNLKLSDGKGNPLIPHDFQIEAFKKAIRKKRRLFLSPTSSGKSLIIYMVSRYLIERGLDSGLILVPTVGLVQQLFSDFKDYSEFNKWDVEKNVHKIFQGQEKKTKKKLTISTWQSIYNESAPFFKSFKYILGDEAHLYQAKSLQSIITKLINAEYRLGFTGTLDDLKTHKLVLEGSFGIIDKLLSTREMIDRGISSDIKVESFLIKHSQEACKALKKNSDGSYVKEIEYLVSNDQRNNFITNLAISLKGNTLVLYQYVDKHGKILHDIIQKKITGNRKVFFVYGKTEAEQREEIRHIVEKEKDAIIVASYGTFSTGINIKNLHNIIFAIGFKSTIRVLQSIGRGLRKTTSKIIMTLYDMGDDLRISTKSKENHTLKHFISRLKLYDKEEFKYEIHKIQLK